VKSGNSSVTVALSCGILCLDNLAVLRSRTSRLPSVAFFVYKEKTAGCTLLLVLSLPSLCLLSAYIYVPNRDLTQYVISSKLEWYSLRLGSYGGRDTATWALGDVTARDHSLAAHAFSMALSASTSFTCAASDPPIFPPVAVRSLLRDACPTSCMAYCGLPAVLAWLPSAWLGPALRPA
jgi:hypothetical protein